MQGNHPPFKNKTILWGKNPVFTCGHDLAKKPNVTRHALRLFPFPYLKNVFSAELATKIPDYAL